jgi:putative hydrolase of the HAD superfamily
LAVKIKAVTFDLDDTLWPVWPAIARAETAMLDWLNEQAPRIVELFDPAALQTLREQIVANKPELAHHISLMRILTMRAAAAQAGYAPEVGEQAFQVMWKERNRVDLFADVEPALRSLRQQGFTIGALSNGNADVAEVGLSSYFDFALNAVNGGAPKPAATMFLRAAQLAKCEPQQIVHVGDDPASDIAGATKAGMISVWLNREGESATGVNADFEITSLAELPALMISLQERGT